MGGQQQNLLADLLKSEARDNWEAVGTSAAHFSGKEGSNRKDTVGKNCGDL